MEILRNAEVSDMVPPLLKKRRKLSFHEEIRSFLSVGEDLIRLGSCVGRENDIFLGGNGRLNLKGTARVIL